LQVPSSEFKTQVKAESSAIGSLAVAEKEHIVRAIREARGVIGGPLGAAALLGIKRTTLQAKTRKLGISRLVPFDEKAATP
jgi:formate hydrogenlyase transcriptional activator